MSDGPATTGDEEYRDVYDRIGAVLMGAQWRTGRKVRRTIYDRPLDSDPLIGVMDYPALAEAVVIAHNARRSGGCS
jgi:hypothetical protein